MKQYNLGDAVWYASYDSRAVEKPCPVCYGQKIVTLILGNGEQVTLDCDYCGKGRDVPRGFIREYEWVAKAEHRAITRVSLETSLTGEQREYSLGGSRVDVQDLFVTEVEALDRCAEMIEQKKIEESTLAHNIKANNLKSYSWNAGYHLRSAEDHRKRAGYHEQKAILCKERAK